MNDKEAAKILRAHNEWRRDEQVPTTRVMIDPKELGLAIDHAVKVLSESLTGIDLAESEGWDDVHGGDTGAYWRGIDPKTGKCEKLPDRYTRENKN